MTQHGVYHTPALDGITWTIRHHLPRAFYGGGGGSTWDIFYGGGGRGPTGDINTIVDTSICRAVSRHSLSRQLVSCRTIDKSFSGVAGYPTYGVSLLVGRLVRCVTGCVTPRLVATIKCACEEIISLSKYAALRLYTVVFLASTLFSARFGAVVSREFYFCSFTNGFFLPSVFNTAVLD